MKSPNDFLLMKQADRKITMITCYDYTSAMIVAKTDIDCVLVGDSSSMLMHGFENTTHSTLDQIEMHTQAVARGAKTKYIISDLPFMSYRKSLSQTVDAVERLVRAGANAIKLEGGFGNFEAIKHLVESGIPVMGHIGLTPQHIHAMGAFKVQGRDTHTRLKLIEEAKKLEDAGCFAIVLECVPMQLAKSITDTLGIPTIGIGGGPHTDGQVLVFHDLLGLHDFKPKFLKSYLNGAELFIDSINRYVTEVRTQKFPQVEHSYLDKVV